MLSDRYIHPEFGCLAPTSRFRRDLRIGLTSLAIGLVSGVVAVVALTAHMRDPEDLARSDARSAAALAGDASPARAGRGGHSVANAAAEGAHSEELAARNETNTTAWSAPPTDKSGSPETAKPPDVPKPAVMRSSNAPAIARLPIGRSQALGDLNGSGAQPRKDLGTAARDATMTDQQDQAALQHGETATGRSSATLPPRKKAERTARRKNPAPDLYRSRDDSADVARASRAYARETTPIPRGFWAWSW
jgi:hypothetical protein